MKVSLERIISDDTRRTAQLEPGEIVVHRVELKVDDRPRSFDVFFEAKVLPGFDASVVYGDELLETLLRFEAAALNDVYAAVARLRRGEPVQLPLLLVDQEPQAVSL